jgi:hypothetical protein
MAYRQWVPPTFASPEPDSRSASTRRQRLSIRAAFVPFMVFRGDLSTIGPDNHWNPRLKTPQNATRRAEPGGPAGLRTPAARRRGSGVSAPLHARASARRRASSPLAPPLRPAGRCGTANATNAVAMAIPERFRPVLCHRDRARGDDPRPAPSSQLRPARSTCGGDDARTSPGADIAQALVGTVGWCRLPIAGGRAPWTQVTAYLGAGAAPSLIPARSLQSASLRPPS